MGNINSTIACVPGSNGGLVPNTDIGSLFFGPADPTYLWAMYCGLDTSGPVMAIVDKPTYYDCIYGCDATPGCQGVSYVGTTCYQKRDPGMVTANNNVWSVVKLVSTYPSCQGSSADGGEYNGFTIECGVDYFGGDIGSTTTPTFGDCINTCASTTGCIDVSYRGENCYMKGQIGAAVQDTAVWTAKKIGGDTTLPVQVTSLTCVDAASDGKTYSSDTGKSYNIKCAADYFGGDIASTNTDTFEHCIAACDAQAGCIDVSYVSGSCYMKGSLSTSTPTPAGHVWTAVLSSALDGTTPPSTKLTCENNASDGKTFTASSGKSYMVHCGTDYFGGDLTSLDAPTFEECIDRCDATSGCLNVAYTGHSCYLKSVTETAVVNPNVWSAVLVTLDAEGAGAAGSNTTALFRRNPISRVRRQQRR